jgi:predicted TIM-barrel fold metal-dependent hydrolase
MDEHWEKRGEYEMPLLKKSPAMLSGSQGCISASSRRIAACATIDYVGAERFLYASDIRHWDNESPENLHDLRDQRDFSDDVKRKILYKNAKNLFAL